MMPARARYASNTSPGRAMAAEIARSCGGRIEVTAAHNSLYGPMVTTAGLLSGADYREALGRYRDWDHALVSRSALNDHEMFIDDLSLTELRDSRPELRIWPSEHVTDTLREL